MNVREGPPVPPAEDLDEEFDFEEDVDDLDQDEEEVQFVSRYSG